MALSADLRAISTGGYLALALTIPGLAGRKGLNTVLWGPPGSGKSALAGEIAGRLGRQVVEFTLGVVEPEDVGGLPVPGPDGSFLRQVDPRLEEAALPGRVLLFDGLTAAVPAVQAASLRVILEREVAGVDLAATPVVATATALEEGGLHPLLAAAANRFLHLRMDGVDVRRHLEGKELELPDLDLLERNFDAALERAWAKFRRFFRSAPDEIARGIPPVSVEGPESAAYASQRSWEMAVLALAACWAAGVEPAPMLAGCVGARAAEALLAGRGPLLELPLRHRRRSAGAADADQLAVAALVPGPGEVAGLPAVAWGAVGSGKSSLVRAVLEELGYRQRTIVLGTWMPSDVGGIPIPAETGHSFRRQVDPILREVSQPGWALVVDDLTFATPAVQNAALDLVLRRRAGDTDLSRTPILVTANPLSSGGRYELTPGLSNRLLHLEVEGAEADRYLLGELERRRQVGVDAGAVRRGFPARLAVAQATVAAFLRSRPADLQRAPVSDRPDGGHDYAYATPRSWELAARALAGCEAAGIAPLPLLVAALGDELGSLLAAWDAEHPLPSPSDVFAGTVRWDELRPDEALAAAKAAALVAEAPGEVDALLREGRRCRELNAPDIFAPAYRVLRSRLLEARLPLRHATALGAAIGELADAVGAR